MKINILCFLLLFFISCKKKDNTSTNSDLVYNRWVLSSFQDIKTHVITNCTDTLESLIFKDSINMVRVNYSGNSCSGSYSINNNAISIGTLNCSGLNDCVTCPWQIFLNNIDSAFQYNVNNNILTLYSKGTYNLNFVAQ